MICADCVGEPYLHELVKKDGDMENCDYCGKEGKVISIEKLTRYVEEGFNTHCRKASSNPDNLEQAIHQDKEYDGFPWYPDGAPIIDFIMDEVGVSEEVAHVIQGILEENYFDYEEASMGNYDQDYNEDSYYEKNISGSWDFHSDWVKFEKRFKYETRFVSTELIELFSRLFDNIDQMQTKEDKPLIIDAGPDTDLNILYRARVFQSDDKLKLAMKYPDKELGPPPPNFASAGRMNAKGISVFYGATSDCTARAEVRPPVGSKVAIIQFKIIRPIRLLDLTALSNITEEEGSIFDPDYKHRIGLKEFLKALSESMIQPVMPENQEIDYLITQAIADFLANERNVPLDGIKYNSVQIDGKDSNVVLFHKASRCRELDIPEGSEIEAEIMDTRNYSDHCHQENDVLYKVTVNYDSTPPPEEEFDPLSPKPYISHKEIDERQETLDAIAETMTIHEIKGIKIKADPFGVKYNIYDENDFSSHFGRRNR